MKNIELHKDLKKHIVTLDSGMEMIHHPLYVGTYTSHPHLNELANNSYKSKKEFMRKYTEEKDIDSFMNLIERPYRVPIIMSVLRSWWKPTKKEYWDVISWIWQDTECVYENLDTWIELMTLEFSEPQLMMNDKEKEVYDNLPKIVRVYRGGVDDRGLSWSLSREKAEWFANRFDYGYKVFEKEINKSDILAYLDGRQEQEIICNVDY
tara:strand:- start:83 stop:706 length:624 start_codon:yes stop_codon:yes gene_type:complete